MNTEHAPLMKREPTRTCVGCGQHDAASALVRLVLGLPDAHAPEIAFDLAGGSFGRGAHVHARPDCLANAPRGLRRSFRRDLGVDGAELGRRLVRACDQRMTGLLLAARRLRRVAVGADAAIEALGRGESAAGGASSSRASPLAVIALDAGTLTGRTEVTGAVAAGRAIAWRTKNELGALLGEQAVAICTVLHDGIAAELKKIRAASDAGVAAASENDGAGSAGTSSSRREGAECSRRPEAR